LWLTFEVKAGTKKNPPISSREWAIAVFELQSQRGMVIDLWSRASHKLLVASNIG